MRGDVVTLLLWFGLLCSSLFMLTCLESMLVFKVSKKRTIVFVVISGTVSAAITALLLALGIDVWQSIWHLYIYIGLLMTAVESFQHKSMLKGLVAGMFGTLYIFGVDGMSTLFFVQFSGYLDESLWNIIFFSHMFVITALVFTFKRVIKNRVDMNVFNNRGTYLVTAVSGIMIIVTYVVYRVDEVYAASGIMYLLVFATIAVMLVVIMNYVFKDNTRRTEMLLAEASKQYIRGLEESYTTLRMIKHDYVNIMTSFKLYIDDRDIDGLAKFYYNELSELNRDLSKENRLIGSLQNVQINEIKSIIIYKCSVAAQHRVVTTIEANDPIESLGVPTSIVCQILGILLDNAIEAAMETDEKNVTIAILANTVSKTFIFKNSWRDQGLDLSKIFELGFSTKADGRGVGLYTVRNYVDKIKGLLIQTKHDSGCFTQILTVQENR